MSLRFINYFHADSCQARAKEILNLWQNLNFQEIDIKITTFMMLIIYDLQ